MYTAALFGMMILLSAMSIVVVLHLAKTFTHGIQVIHEESLEKLSTLTESAFQYLSARDPIQVQEAKAVAIDNSFKEKLLEDAFDIEEFEKKYEPKPNLVSTEDGREIDLNSEEWDILS